MNAASARRRPGWAQDAPRLIVAALLVVWAVGLAVAAFELVAWRLELGRTLMQMRADTVFLARAQRRAAVAPEWYRRKAVALIASTERLERNTAWTLFIPGSWHVFDDLEERVAARIEAEFDEIVVETVRREVYAAASRITGAPLHPGGDGLRNEQGCGVPAPRATTLPEPAELVATRDYLVALEGLDRAAQALLALHRGDAQPAHLQAVVGYTLQAELPGALARSARRFHRPTEVALQPALMEAALRQAAACKLFRGLAALNVRLLEGQALFRIEDAIDEQARGLFDAGSRPPLPFDRAVERYGELQALIDEQEALLTRTATGWMRPGQRGLAPGHDELLVRAGRIGVLGPQVQRQAERQAMAAVEAVRLRFAQRFTNAREPGVVWRAAEQRFGLAPDRLRLREGLRWLLAEPFMAEAPLVAGGGGLESVADDAQRLGEARDRFVREQLPGFPEGARAAVARQVDQRIADLVYQAAWQTLKAELPSDASAPLDTTRFRHQRALIAQVRTTLDRTGGRALGRRLDGALDEAITSRLAVLLADWHRQQIFDTRLSDFTWWQGEANPLAATLGPDAFAVRETLRRHADRLAMLGGQAGELLEIAGPAAQADGMAAQWRLLRTEADRFRTNTGDGSFADMERYVTTVATDLRRDNCLERLAPQAPPAGTDDVAQASQRLHRALLARCLQLRGAALAAPPAGYSP